MSARALNIIYTAEDRVSPTLRKIEAANASMATKLQSVGATIGRVGSKLSSWGSTLTRTVTLPVIGIGIAAGKAAIDFQTAMRRIQTQAGGSAKDVAVLSKQVLALGMHSQFGPSDLADSLYHLKSVGMDNVSAMKALTASTKLAAVGGTDLETVTNALAGAWRSGIKGAGNFSSVVAHLNAIVGAGNMSMHDLVGALGTGVLPAARAAGLTINDVGAALSLLTDNGVPANAAATRLRMTFALLAAPSAKAASELKTIGINSLDLGHAMRSPEGLLKALEILKSHLDRIKDPAKQAQLLVSAFGGGRSSATLISLIQNLGVLQGKYQQIDKTAGHFNQDVAAQSQTAAAKFHRAWASLQVVGVKLGQQLLPVAEKIVKTISGWVSAFERLSPSTQGMIIKIGLLAAAAGPLLKIFGGLLKIFGGLVSGSGKLIGLFGRLGGAASGVGGAATGAGSGAAGGAVAGGTGAAVGAETGAAVGGAAAGAAGVAIVAGGLGLAGLATGGIISAIKYHHQLGKELATETQRLVEGKDATHHLVAAEVNLQKVDTQTAKTTHVVAGETKSLTKGGYVALAGAVQSVNDQQGVFNKAQQQADSILSKAAISTDTFATKTVGAATSLGHMNTVALTANQAGKAVASTFKMMEGSLGQNADKARAAAVRFQLLHDDIGQMDTGSKQLTNSMRAVTSGLRSLTGDTTSAGGAANAASSKFHMLRDAVDAVPTSKHVKITVDDGSALATVAAYNSYLSHIPRTITTVMNVDTSLHGGLPHRAAGGPVTSGQAYVVGENGPEMFVPAQSGSIVPNGRMRAGDTGLRIVEGRLSIDESGRAYIRGVVQEVNGEDARYARSVGRQTQRR